MGTMKKLALISLAAVLGIGIAAHAGSSDLQKMQSALVFLQKARMTSAVQAKKDSLMKARDLLVLVKYDRGGNRAAALASTIQAIARTGEFNLIKANQFIDLAIVKAKRCIESIRQASPAGKKAPVRAK
jgi:hypothetical protein